MLAMVTRNRHKLVKDASPLNPRSFSITPRQSCNQLIPRRHAHPSPGPLPGALQVRQLSICGSNSGEAMRALITFVAPYCREVFELLSGIGSQVDLRALQMGMS